MSDSLRDGAPVAAASKRPGALVAGRDGEVVLSVSLRIQRAGMVVTLDRDLPLDGVTAIFGRSGAGKSSLLRAIAGLEPAAQGRVTVGGEVWQDRQRFLAPERRRAGLVFQDGRLFGHLDVAGNLAYGARRRPAGPIDRQEIIAALDLAPLLSRRVQDLSGGERQRVALGRTLLSQPRLLLLDEPLAALDLAARRSVMGYLERIIAETGLPALLVSHSVEEVQRLADRALVLEQGREVAFGPVAEVMEALDLSGIDDGGDVAVVLDAHLVAPGRDAAPVAAGGEQDAATAATGASEDPRSAHDPGAHGPAVHGPAVLAGSADDGAAGANVSPEDAGFGDGDEMLPDAPEAFGLMRLEVAGQRFILPRPARGPGSGSARRLRVRARDVALSRTRPRDTSVQNILRVRVRAIVAEAGPFAIVELDLGGQILKSRITRLSVAQLRLEPGQEVFAMVKSASMEG